MWIRRPGCIDIEQDDATLERRGSIIFNKALDLVNNFYCAKVVYIASPLELGVAIENPLHCKYDILHVEKAAKTKRKRIHYATIFMKKCSYLLKSIFQKPFLSKK